MAKLLHAVLVKKTHVFLKNSVPSQHSQEVLAEHVGASSVDLRVLLKMFKFYIM